MRRPMTVVVFAAAGLFASGTLALSPAEKCESGKLKESGKYGFCRLNAAAKAVKAGTIPDYTKCDGKFEGKWTRLDESGACPTMNDLMAIQSLIIQHADDLEAALAGTPPAARFVDNADGTITDNQTGLDWEKKVQSDTTPNAANLHDADNNYPWAGKCTVNDSKYCQPTAAAAALCAEAAVGGTTGCDVCTGGEGTCNKAATVWTWAATLNTANFGGHSDWRVPTRLELVGIFDSADTIVPKVNLAFHGPSCGFACSDITSAACSCMVSSFYWSGSSYVDDTANAWNVSFGDGFQNPNSRIESKYVRAVRTGP